jgi:glycosyltransferase involved in cell wall biosynthesis
MTVRPLRLLTVGHSYVVALNRRLPNEIARVTGGRWQVSAVAPEYVRAELRDIAVEHDAKELCRLEVVGLYATRHLHVMAFGLRLREILRQGWDMVHIYQEPYIVAGWQTAWWTPKSTPLVFFTAQNISKKYPPPFSAMERYCLDRCAGWIACGNTVTDALLQKGYGTRPHRTIGFGVDTDLFRPDKERRERMQQRLGWDGSVPVIAFLGRLTPEKGLTLLTSVLDRLITPWRALLIGSGPMLPEMEDWSRKHQGRVRIIAATHDEVPAYLNVADILCAPSQTMANWREQFGRMLIEGMSSGLAVVGSDSGEIPNVLGEAGVVVGERDENAWVRTLEGLLADKSACEELGQRGRARVLDHFSWPVIAQKHVEFFDHILANSAPSASV